MNFHFKSPIQAFISPESFVLYYPSGESSDAIREYISIGNANAYDVDYTITLRFEDPLIAPLQFTGSIGAGRRGGVTLSDGDPATVTVPKAAEQKKGAA